MLHDFCMVIPFSAIIAAAALVTLVLGSRRAGLQLLVASSVMGYTAASSLSRWKKGCPSRLVTALGAGECLAVPSQLVCWYYWIVSELRDFSAGAGVAAGLVHMFWTAAASGVAPAVTYSLAALSAAMTLFLVYNIAAGGNPPRRSEVDQALPDDTAKANGQISR